MVSSKHEALHRIFQEDSGLVIRTVQDVLKIEFPKPTRISVFNTDATEIEPLERRIDTVLEVDSDHGNFLFAIEAQGKKDPEKLSSWAYYLAYLQAKFKREPVLIVVCHTKATARWASQPIEFGLPGCPSLIARPLVLGPHNVPVITDKQEAARDIPLAVFSVLTHSRSRKASAILEALAEALKTLDAETAALFAVFVEVGLGQSRARSKWKELMTALSLFRKSELVQEAVDEVREEVREEGLAEGLAEGLVRGREEGLAEGKAEGRAQQLAENIIEALQLRGVMVPGDVCARVLNCTDLSQLKTWWAQALRVTDANEIFSAG